MGVVFIGVLIIISSFILSASRLLNCLIVIENLNILILFTSLFCQWDHFRVLFIILMVVFTVEVTISLVVLSRLWSFSGLMDIVGF